MCNVINSNKNQPRAVAVTVINSNLPTLKSGKEYTFAEFENRALCVALANTGGASQRVQVEVLFINNRRFQCFLELGQRDPSNPLHLGFYDYCYQSLKELKKKMRHTTPHQMIKNHFIKAQFDVFKEIFIDVVEVAKANALLQIAKKHGTDHKSISLYLYKS